MRWFRCLVQGVNLPGSVIQRSGDVGFYVTRFVAATHATEAEAVARRGLEEELVDYRSALSPSLEEVEEVPAAEVPSVSPGFTWYPMERD